MSPEKVDGVSVQSTSKFMAASNTACAQRPKETGSTVWKYLSQDLRGSTFTEAQLVLLTFCTGIQDYHCFASNQTGNTVFLCLALVLPRLDGDVFITANIGMALGLFLGAGWLTGQISHLIGPRKRWWLILCNLIQSACVFAAAAIQYRQGIVPKGPEALAVIGLLAFAAGSQVVQSRSFSITEISTAMATAAWVDLMIDEKLFAATNRPRSRRIAFLVSLVVGTLVGAAIYREAGSPTALAVSGGGKLLVTTSYFFSPREGPNKDPSPA
ncbi:hypothetical protein E4U10_001713 [Claviceps purpurea]|nr:hypothetical protein E4U10_001713 [Claviceps purpurea]KAG6228065.1 hypothetical protein E4U26_001309 [Claviceps purpurea]